MKRNFFLNEMPVDHILTVHVNNLDLYMHSTGKSFVTEWEAFKKGSFTVIENHLTNLKVTYGEQAITDFLTKFGFTKVA